jgi:AcrR family transcriptional regulator
MAIIGRPRGFDRDAALESAMVLFWRKGFAAASMNDLCDAMSIRSPSLYAAFGSKEALYLEAIEHYVQTNGPPIWDRLTEGATARACVENLLLAASEILPDAPTSPGGCMVTLGAVCDEWPPPIIEAVRNVRLHMLDMLRARLEFGVANGELPASTDIDSLSRFYLGVYTGMAVQARDGASAGDLRGLVTAAMGAWPSGSRGS